MKRPTQRQRDAQIAAWAQARDTRATIEPCMPNAYETDLAARVDALHERDIFTGTAYNKLTTALRHERDIRRAADHDGYDEWQEQFIYMHGTPDERRAAFNAWLAENPS